MSRVVDMLSGWVILTMASTRTLDVAASLTAAGIECWAPQRVERRMGRGRKRKEVVTLPLAIAPGFVFARASRLSALLADRAAMTSPHPRYRILRDGERIPLVADTALTALRAAEERFRVSHLKTLRRGRLAVGTELRFGQGALAGLTGIVEGEGAGGPRVRIGNGFTLTIASYLIGTDVVREASKPITGTTA